MSSATDFDFFMGSWTVRNRYLGERLKGSEDWAEFGATSEARPLPGVLGNEDEFRTDALGGFVGMSFRFFDAERERWSIYWADSRRPGELDPPVFGTFDGDVGIFEGFALLELKGRLENMLWDQVSGAFRWPFYVAAIFAALGALAGAFLPRRLPRRTP
jgi:hypothetical protein